MDDFGPHVPDGFDPDAEWTEKAPEEMTDEERHTAVLGGFYELNRLLIRVGEMVAYLGAVAGISDEDAEALAELAELAEDDDDDLDDDLDDDDDD